MKILINSSWIVKPNGETIRNGWVVVENGKIRDYCTKPPEGEFHRTVHLTGYLYPPFVNAHTHLELSTLTFNPDTFPSFFDWLLWIIGRVRLLTEKEIEKALILAENELASSGVYYAGDISSFGISPVFPFQKLNVKPFREFIGKVFSPSEFPPPVSAHSVYSVSFEALKKIAKDSLEREYPFQIHVGETYQEQLFVQCRENLFENLVYPAIGRKRYERKCAENIVDYLSKAGAVNEKLIAVHCTNLTKKELDILMEANASIVLCPRSNLHLKVGFPQVEHLLGYNKLALATDGLSSNINLSVVEELKTVYYRLEGRVSLKELFHSITGYAAKALHIHNYGEKAVFTFAPSERVDRDPFTFLLGAKELKILDYTSLL